MILKSFVKDYFGLRPIDVEVVFTTGLPQISILGLPDKVIQESAKRIQTALTAQGFQMPKAKQVLVNLWPREIRKTSLGVDLAIALGILAESGQRNLFATSPHVAVYGELSLGGEVRAPRDIEALANHNVELITGGPVRSYAFPVSILETLQSEMVMSRPCSRHPVFTPPPLKSLRVNEDVARLLQIISIGEHSLVLAGPPGSGKTTFAEILPSLLREPEPARHFESQNIARYFGEDLRWRPVVAPHHTTPAISMLGGGVPPRPGQIVRAHGGLLILDELLEFDPMVQSALRETLQSGRVDVARGVHHETFAADFMTVATTNLCRCGEFVPLARNHCRCSAHQMRSYAGKLSGPFIDRFTALHFTHEWGARGDDGSGVSLETLRDHLKEVHLFQKKQKRHCTNEKMSVTELQQGVREKSVLTLFETFRSQRRRSALWRLARSFADLDMSENIDATHVERAHCLAISNFNFLKDLSVTT